MRLETREARSRVTLLTTTTLSQALTAKLLPLRAKTQNLAHNFLDFKVELTARSSNAQLSKPRAMKLGLLLPKANRIMMI